MRRDVRRRRVFMSIAAQEDNLGDIAIRSVAAQWMADTGHELVVFTGSMSASYVEALNLPASAVRVSERRQFLTRLLRSALECPTLIVFAPGPAGVGRDPRLIFRSLTNRMLVGVAMLSGGGTISLGRAFRGDSGLALRLERSIAKASLIHTVRDPASADLIGSATEVAPDLAFALRGRGASSITRDHVAVSIRDVDDYPQDLLASLFSKIRAAGLRPLLVTQVQRDGEGHEALAVEHAVRHVAWPIGKSHAEQWSSVCSEYARCAFIVSNRLHGLLFGVTEGAVPVVLGPSEKAPTTLNFLLDFMTIDPENPRSLDGVFDSLEGRSQRMDERVTAARGRLLSVRVTVDTMLASCQHRSARPETDAVSAASAQDVPQMSAAVDPTAFRGTATGGHACESRV